MNPADRQRLLQARERAENERARFLALLGSMRDRYSLADLGEALGVSRQSVHKMLKRAE